MNKIIDYLYNIGAFSLIVWLFLTCLGLSRSKFSFGTDNCSCSDHSTDSTSNNSTVKGSHFGSPYTEPLQAYVQNSKKCQKC